MRISTITMYFTAAFFLTSPVVAHAFWGADGDRQSGLNLETGYDVNTVTTLSGRIVSVQTEDTHRNSQFELDSNGSRTIVVLGPQRYWSENGIALKANDTITVTGSKAQGKDGNVYVLAQKVTDTTLNSSISLRNESGRPAWAGSGMGKGQGRINRPAHATGKMGGGKMNR